LIKIEWLIKTKEKVLSHDTYGGISIRWPDENSKEVWEAIYRHTRGTTYKLKHHLVEHRQVNFDKYPQKYKDVYGFSSSGGDLVQEIPYCDEEVWLVMFLEER
jgi:hypothetical protein